MGTHRSACSIWRRSRFGIAPRTPHVAFGVALFMASLTGVATPGWALPVDGKVAEGAATINQSNASTMQIRQATERALLNWQGFSIGAGETVQFLQPGASSLAVNRVLGPEASLLLGNLLANGRVFLLNPNGVVIASTGVINAAGFFATTLSLTDRDLLAGRFSFEQDPSKALAAVVNQGTIRVTDGGFVILTAPGVANEGLIVATLGRVGLAAGTQLAVDFQGDGLIQYAVTGAAAEAVTNPQGQTLNSAVSNAGRIEADGGRVLLSAHATEAVFASVINQNGVIQAQRLENDGGGIVLRGGSEGAVMVAGTLDATGVNGRGGTIDARGAKVELTKTAKLDVSGETGGGTITVGGGFQGKDGGPNASETIVMPGAQLSANATGNGDGGAVIVWADGLTQYGGAISARGGPQGGNGGFAEVSGKDFLGFAGTVDTRAPLGQTGTLLLDPKFGITGNNGTGAFANNTFSDNAAGTTTIGADSLSTQLDTTGVMLQANTDWTFANNTDAVTGSHALAVQAGRSIIFDAGAKVNLNNANFTATVNAAGAQPVNRDTGTAQFSMAAGSQITTGDGWVAVDVGNFGGANVGEVRIGNGTGPATISTGSGSIFLNGRGRGSASSADGIRIDSGSLVQTTSGDINIFGQGGAGLDFNRGVSLTDVGTQITTETGTITIDGNGAGTGAANAGVVMLNGAKVALTGFIADPSMLKIQVNGNGAPGTSYNHGAVIAGSGTAVTTTGGRIQITGSGGGADGQPGPNLGVTLALGGAVNGTNDAEVTITGLGGLGYGYSINTGGAGIFVIGPLTEVSAVDGALTLTGFGGGTGNAGYGVIMYKGGIIRTTGNGQVTLTGAGSTAGTSYSHGVVVADSGTTLQTMDGALTIIGTGGGNGAGFNNFGVSIALGALVQATGSGDVAINGTGGNGASGSIGVMVFGGTTMILSNTGDITIDGSGDGVALIGGPTINSTGGGTVTIIP